jgi:hypothetical protein
MTINKALYGRQPGILAFFKFVVDFYFLLFLWFGFKMKCQALPIWIEKLKYFCMLLFSARCCLREIS